MFRGADLPRFPAASSNAGSRKDSLAGGAESGSAGRVGRGWVPGVNGAGRSAGGGSGVRPRALAPLRLRRDVGGVTRRLGFISAVGVVIAAPLVAVPSPHFSCSEQSVSKYFPSSC